MKFLNLLAVAGCVSLAVIGSATLYGCNHEAKAEAVEEPAYNVEIVPLGKLYSLTLVQNDVDTFKFNNVAPDLYKALKAGEHLYIYDVYSPREQGHYNTWSEKACLYGSWEVIEGDTVKVCNLLYEQ